jgi:hypothetical protein
MDSLDILKPEFSIDQVTWDDKLRISSHLIENRDIYPKVLGKISQNFSSKERKKFVQDLEASTGQKVSTTSIRVYAWMYSKVWSLPNCPADLSLQAVKLIAGMPNPAEWVQKVNDNGWSSLQLVREILGEQKPSVKRCRVCGAEQ